jgi:hypothetical protein
MLLKDEGGRMKDEFLIDAFMPEYEHVERHSIAVNAPVEQIFAAIRVPNFDRSPLARLLLRLRGIKKFDGFTVIANDPPRELLLAIEGPFWRVTCPPHAILPGVPQRPGTARGAWNFIVEPGRLSTETRVRCADAASHRRFRVYWFFVRPFSGLLRRLMLRSIRREAERA